MAGNRFRRRSLPAGLLVFFLILSAARAPALRVAVIQLAAASGEAEIEGAVQWAGLRGCDLAIFPEYAGVFLALAPWQRVLEGSPGIQDAIARIRAADPRVGSIRDFLLLVACESETRVAGIFGGLARRYGIAIVAGTTFARAAAADGRDELRNRAFLFDGEGTLIRVQDKVWLSEFETGVLGISPGRPDRVTPIRIGDALVGVTICRDTFSPEWESVFRGADLWIDLKANGAPFTEEERRGFARALPARLPGAGVRCGVTACLVGSFLDLAWEGESSVIQLEGGAVETIARSPSASAAGVLLFDLPPDSGAP